MKKVINYLIIILISLQAVVFAQKIEFIDLSKNHWAYNSVLRMVHDYKIISGFPDNTFRGNKLVNRFELIICTNKFLKTIENMYNISLKENINYSIVLLDVPKTHWAYNEINETINIYHIPVHNVINGIFDGEKLINRYELAYTLVNIIQLIERNKPGFKIIETQSNKTNSILDLNDDFWATPSVKLAVDKYNLLSVFPDNTFRGSNNITRYELVASFDRLASNIKKFFNNLESLK